jgi:dihydroflavonol-4-reductase
MILVTGGTGLVGSHLLFELAQKNEKVRAIRRQSSNLEHVRYIFSLYAKDAEKLLDRIEWIEADIEDIESLNMSFEGIRQVYHCAAMVSFDPREKYDMIRNNQEGCANLVNVCLEKKIDKLCYVSSTSALGSAPENMMVTEDHVWSASKHRSAYSVSKFRSEMEVWRGIAEGLNAVIVNPSIIIGPGDWDRSSSRLFSVVWKGMKYYTEGVTGYVDIFDVVSAMIRLMESDVSAERYTLSSENLSYRQILEIIAENLNKKPPRIHAGPILLSIAWRLDWLNHRITGQKRSITKDAVVSSRTKSYFSNQKITDELGLEFKSIAESLKSTAHLFLDYTSGKTAIDAES